MTYHQAYTARRQAQTRLQRVLSVRRKAAAAGIPLSLAEGESTAAEAYAAADRVSATVCKRASAAMAPLPILTEADGVAHGRREDIEALCDAWLAQGLIGALPPKDWPWLDARAMVQAVLDRQPGPVSF